MVRAPLSPLEDDDNCMERPDRHETGYNGVKNEGIMKDFYLRNVWESARAGRMN